MTNDQQCAVWYMRYYSAYYKLCADEQEAVRFAYNLADSEEGAVTGVQFADGRLVKSEEWQALDEYETERYRAWRDAVNEAPAPPPPSRTISDPFNGKQASVEGDVPDWLGRPTDG